MLFEPSDREPDEYDPEDDLEDPDADGPTIPRVATDEYAPDDDYEDWSADGPEIPRVSTDETDAPNELLRTFWILVVVANAAVLALSLGALFLAFRGNATTGGGLLAGGVVLVALGIRHYRALDDVQLDEDDGGDANESAEEERTDGPRGAAETVSDTHPVDGSPEESTSDDENRT